MIYGAGDAINGVGALDNQIAAQLSSLSRVVTNRYVAATAELDSSSAPSLRYVLDPSGTQPVFQLPELDTGDPNALVDFVNWSAATCAAQRSILVLSGHGTAWEDQLARDVVGTRGLSSAPMSEVPGALHHARRLFGRHVDKVAAARAVLVDGSDRDYLSNAELAAACDRIAALLGHKIDVLVFDACLMSSWELLQEISGAAATIVASVDELSAAGIDIAQAATKFSTAQGLMDPGEMATAFVAGFLPRTAFDSCLAIDISNPAWMAAMTYFRTFSGSFLAWIQTNQTNAEAARGALKYASTSLVQYTTGGLADISALSAAIASLPGLSALCIQNLNAAVASLRACVLSKSVGRDYQLATGLSIFSPNSLNVYSTNRPDYLRLQFANASGWGPILDALYGFENAYGQYLVKG
jgi:cysteine peptidase C11 family protein